MILYLVHDSTTNSYSHPLVGPDLQTVVHSLQTLNPSNLSSLSIFILTELTNLSELLLLHVYDERRSTPDIITSDFSFTPEKKFSITLPANI